MVNMAADSTSLDRIDSEILAILRDDARIPYQTLGDRVHLSANAAAERVRRLVRSGVIRRFTVDVAADARVVVRVTLAGHAPWSSVVTVKGRRRLRVKASLQPR